jgi:hypothetical protein
MAFNAIPVPLATDILRLSARYLPVMSHKFFCVPDTGHHRVPGIARMNFGQMNEKWFGLPPDRLSVQPSDISPQPGGRHRPRQPSHHGEIRPSLQQRPRFSIGRSTRGRPPHQDFRPNGRDRTSGFGAHVYCGRRRLLEEVLVNLLDVEDLLNPTADVVPGHKLGEMLSVDQDNPLAEKFGGFFGRG